MGCRIFSKITTVVCNNYLLYEEKKSQGIVCLEKTLLKEKFKPRHQRVDFLFICMASLSAELVIINLQPCLWLSLPRGDICQHVSQADYFLI